MEINPQASKPSNQSKGNNSAQIAAGAAQFDDLLKKKSKNVTDNAVQASGKITQLHFAKKKEKVDMIDHVEEDEENESLEKTLKKIKKRLKDLAKLERQGLGL